MTDQAFRPKARPAGWNEFERFCLRAYPQLAAQLHAVLGERDRAHRIANDAFAQAWLQWSKVRPLDDRAAWVRRRAARHLRWSNRWRRVSGPLRWWSRSPDPAERLVSNAVLAALGQLPLVQRRALVLHYLAGLTTQQVAEEEHTSTKVILQRLAHGRLALGHRVASDGRAAGDADVTAGQWATGPIDDWVARQLTYLEYRLASRPDTRPVLAAARTVRHRRRARVAGLAGAVAAAGLGAAVAVMLSMGIRGGNHPGAGASPADVGPVQGTQTDLPLLPGAGGSGQPSSAGPVARPGTDQVPTMPLLQPDQVPQRRKVHPAGGSTASADADR